VSEYPLRERALAPPLRKECVLMRNIGIPLFDGYCSSVAADFRALLMCSTVTSARAPSDQYDESTSEAAPCPLQPYYFDKWDFFADIWDCQYAMGFPVCIFMYLGVSLHNFLPIFPISRYFLMSE